MTVRTSPRWMSLIDTVKSAKRGISAASCAARAVLQVAGATVVVDVVVVVVVIEVIVLAADVGADVIVVLAEVGMEDAAEVEEVLADVAGVVVLRAIVVVVVGRSGVCVLEVVLGG